ncbi:MAG: protein phosphatase 2C domain-containing protein [Actinobacteria bacterium]|nr:protein phosphatase 2C domain-containing protein [Actinomycetota bacterium]
MSDVQHSVLWGHDHPQLGVVATEEISPRVAIALSRGKYPKGYPHLDPNEDAVAAATDGRATLLAVADGHSGHDAATAAIQTIVDSASSLLAGVGPNPQRLLRNVLEEVARAIGSTRAANSGERARSRTALSIALLAPDLVTAVGFGDTRVVLVGRSGATFLGSPAPFLGSETELTDVTVADSPVTPGDTVLAASDGLLDFLGPDGLGRLAEMADGASAGGLARAAVEAAFEGAAGDNIAVAVGSVGVETSSQGE